jgi:enediyne biosynthesis protein E4
MRPPRGFWLLSSLLVLLAAGWGVFGYYSSQEKRFRADIGQAKNDLGVGRLAYARARLRDLSARWPTDGETAYYLGRCEEDDKNIPAALAAWERVPAGSPFATRAAVRRASVLLNSGQFGKAEAILEALPRTGGPDASEVRQALELVYRFQGRMGDVRRLIVESWQGADDPPAILRRLFVLERAKYPSETIEKLLALSDPEDDRAWLASANRAILSGQSGDAANWLDKCKSRRPDDPAVWQAYLDLARSTGDGPAAFRAMEHLPAQRFSEAQRRRLRAWFVGRSGDSQRERKALEDSVAEDPGDTAAWDRLAELALSRGEIAEAERFRRRKAELMAMNAQYSKLIDRDDRAEKAGELASLAAGLGRRDEERGWLLVKEGRGGRESLEDEKTRPPDGSTLAALFAELRSAGPGRAIENPLAGEMIPEFRDDAEVAGLRFIYDNGHTSRKPAPPEAMGGGVGLLDFDGDGRLDVYLVQGGPFPSGQSVAQDGDRLFRNKGDGAFDDVTERSGLAALGRGYGHGVAVGDYDNDGWPDLFVTRWRSYALYHNRGDGTFEDATTRVGLGGDRDWPTSAAFADLDRDGDLDLYVCHYLKYDENNPLRCSHHDSPARHECNPLDFDALPDHVFQNDAGRFVDITAPAGLLETAGRGLGVVAADFDGDDLIDLFVANDMSANYLYRNKGGFRFEEVGIVAGAAASAEGGYKAGMGIAYGDLDGDGKLDLAVTNYYGESTTFYRNLGGGMFADYSNAIGLSAPTRLLLGFGIAFGDVDNDGRLDVLSANGHVIDPRPRFPWMMPLQVLSMSRRGRLVDVSDRAGALFKPLHLGRGLAVGDLDNDGRVDAVAICQNEPIVYLHNQTRREPTGHFLVLRLEGTKSNRDGVGATVTVSCGHLRWIAARYGGGSYQSANDPRLRFGLGAATNVDRVEVRWPTGLVDRFAGVKVDAGYLLREGEGIARPLKGFGPR